MVRLKAVKYIRFFQLFIFLYYLPNLSYHFYFKYHYDLLYLLYNYDFLYLLFNPYIKSLVLFLSNKNISYKTFFIAILRSHFFLNFDQI